MRAYPKNRWVSGSKKEECPRCGFDFVTAEMIFEERTGKLVCQHCYDPIHPQDLPKKKGAQSRGTDASASERIYREEA